MEVYCCILSMSSNAKRKVHLMEFGRSWGRLVTVSESHKAQYYCDTL